MRDRAVCTEMANGLGQSEEVVWYYNLLARLPEEVLSHINVLLLSVQVLNLYH